MLALWLKSCVCPRDQPSAKQPGDHPAWLSCVSAQVGKGVKRETDHSSGNLSQPPKGCTELRLEHTHALRSDGKQKVGLDGADEADLSRSLAGWLCLIL